MGKNKRLAIIGHFGGKETFLDGQTVKTKVLYEELSKATDWKLIKVDTYYKKKNPIKLVAETLFALLTTKDMIVLLSGNGMRAYFPLLSFFARFSGTRVYHDVIGGNLNQYVERFPAFKKYLNSFCVNWVETRRLKQLLTKQGIKNAEVLPNFKRLSVLPEAELHITTTEPYRFCTFSRVMKEKGIEDAIFAVDTINQKEGRIACTLDIYGAVDNDYADRFKEIMATASSVVRYCGVVPYDESVEIIKGYYALLFPTFWKGEGFAGTIVDAFSAGLPVIATDWGSNSEIIKHGKTGLLYPNGELGSLESAIVWAMAHPCEFLAMKHNCLRCAKQYQPDGFMQLILTKIEKA